MSLLDKHPGAARVLLIAVATIVVFAIVLAVLRPKVAVIHMVTNDWSSWGRPHNRLRSFVFLVCEGEKFGADGKSGRAVGGSPFELRRIVSDDSVEIGQIRSDEPNPMIAVKLAGFDSTNAVIVSHDQVKIWTVSEDGGTEYFLRLDSVRESGFWEMSGLVTIGRETTEIERPDTSILLEQKTD